MFKCNHFIIISMRPLLWGTIWFFIGLVGWVIFSIFAALSSFGGAEKSSLFFILMYIFGSIFFFSLPAAIIIEIYQWFRRRQKNKDLNNSSTEQYSAKNHCPNCGNSMPLHKKYCDNCGQLLQKKD